LRRYGILLLILLGSSACAGGRIVGGVFYSDKGYRVTLPANGWRVLSAGEADLALEQPEWGAGMLLHATCGASAPRRSLRVLARHLTFGLLDRKVLEHGEATVTGLPALRSLLQGELDGRAVRVETYVLRDGTCVYDMVYVAPPTEFPKGVSDFQAFVSSFASR
jgi:hypothetical protein